MKKNFLTILTIFAVLTMGTASAQARVYPALASLIGLKTSQTIAKDLLHLPPSTETANLRALLVGPDPVTVKAHNPMGNPYRAAHVIAGQVSSSPMKMIVALPMFSARGEYVGLTFQLFVESGTQVIRDLDLFPRTQAMSLHGMAIEGFRLNNKPYRVESVYVRFAETTEKQINDLAHDLEQLLADAR